MSTTTHEEDILAGDPRRADVHGKHIDPNASPSTIEKQIDAKRADIDRTLSALEQQFSPSQMFDRGVGLMRENGGEFVQNIGRQFRDNPLPLLLTGVGLVWAMSSQGSGGSRSSMGHYRSRYGYDGDYQGRDFDTRRDFGMRDERHDLDRGTSGRSDARYAVGSAGSDFTPRYTEGSLPSTSGAYADGMYDDHDDDDGFLDSVREGFDKLGNRISDTADDLSRKVSDMGDEARNRYESMNDEARRRYDEGRRKYAEMDAHGRQRYHEARRHARSRREDLQRGMRDGMQSLQAYGRDAGRRVRRGASSAADSVEEFVQEQPMVAGAIGAAIGALVGSLLPATRIEDRYFGEYADDAKREARDQAESGLQSAREEAEGGLEQLRGKVEDAASSARESVEQAAGEARERAESGLDEADRKASRDGEGTPASPKV